MYDISSPPHRTSRLVETARAHLLSDLNLHSLSSDLTRISLLLSLAYKASVATSNTPLTTQIKALSSKIQTLYNTTISLLSLHITASQSVVSTLPNIHSLLSHHQISPALDSLLQNDHLSHTLIHAATSLSNNLSQTADQTLSTIESAQALQSIQQSHKHHLEDLTTEFRARRAAAWHTHSAILESLAEAGRLYERAARAERRASTRCALFSVFGLLEKADAFLMACFGVPWLAPLRHFLEGVRKDAAHAGLEKLALLEAKKRQRGLYRDALKEVGECGGKIKKLGGEVEAIDAAIESLRAVAGELKRLSVLVMRTAAFWAQVKVNVGRLSAAEVAALIKATSEVESGEGDGEDEEVDVSEVRVWEPSIAVRRKILGYYARWVALGDVCRESLADVTIAMEKASTLAEEDRGMSLGPENAALEVAKLTSDLCRDMDRADADIDRYQAALLDKVHEEKL